MVSIARCWTALVASGILGLLGCDLGSTSDSGSSPRTSIQIARDPVLSNDKWNSTRTIRVRILRDSATLLDTILPTGARGANLPPMPQETGFMVEAAGFDSSNGLLWVASLAVPRSAQSDRFLLLARSPARRPALAPTPLLTLSPAPTSGTLAIVLSTTIPGIPIHYSLDGSNPTANSPIWTDTLEAKVPFRIRAIALTDTLQPSWVLDSTVKAWP